MIPTLIDYGELEMAVRAAEFLVSVQEPDGSFRGIDGKVAVFDTGACFEGLRAALSISKFSGFSNAAKKAETWLRTAEDSGELYLWRVRGLLGTAQGPENAPTPNYRTHYWAYALEGIYRLGEFDFVRAELEKLPRGMQPYTLDGRESDTCATAQVAKLRILLGMDAAQEIRALRGLVNSDGSLPHDLVNKKKVAWAAKYYLDVEHLLMENGYDTDWWKVREWEFQEFNIDLNAWKAEKPFGISGCFRVRNDHEFLREAVESHLPYLDEAVIALQPSDVETSNVVADLVADYPDKVRVVQYPVAPVFITSPEWGDVPENSIRSFVYLSNWALSQCKFSWIARIEADVICLSSFQNIVDRIKAEPDRMILYGRVILNVAGAKRDQISATVPRNGGWDECVFPNTPEYHFVRKPRYEVLLSPFDAECLGWSALHMKRCKSDKIGWNNEEYADFDPLVVARVLKEYNAKNAYPGPDNPNGELCLFERDFPYME